MSSQLPAPLVKSLRFPLSKVVPWGRNRVEYAAMFDFGRLPPGRRILDCAGGPTSFAAEMADQGFDVIAADPLFLYDKTEIAGRIAEARHSMMAGVKANADRFRWDDYGNPEGLEATRLATMKFFLEDYEEDRAQGRYVPAALPHLPFAAGRFDLRWFRTSSFSMPSNWIWISTWPVSGSFAAWHRTCGSFPCSTWKASFPAICRRSWKPLPAMD